MNSRKGLRWSWAKNAKRPQIERLPVPHPLPARLPLNYLGEAVRHPVMAADLYLKERHFENWKNARWN